MEDNMNACPMCTGKHKDRNSDEIKDLLNRLKRIEGQEPEDFVLSWKKL